MVTLSDPSAWLGLRDTPHNLGGIGFKPLFALLILGWTCNSLVPWYKSSLKAALSYISSLYSQGIVTPARDCWGRGKPWACPLSPATPLISAGSWRA